MIKTHTALAKYLLGGGALVRLAEFERSQVFRWVTADTNEPVRITAVRALERAGSLAVVARDLCGDPISLRWAADG